MELRRSIRAATYRYSGSDVKWREKTSPHPSQLSESFARSVGSRSGIAGFNIVRIGSHIIRNRKSPFDDPAWNSMTSHDAYRSAIRNLAIRRSGKVSIRRRCESRSAGEN